MRALSALESPGVMKSLARKFKIPKPRTEMLMESWVTSHNRTEVEVENE